MGHKESRDRVLNKQGPFCAYCNTETDINDRHSDKYFTIDHVIPKNLGGMNDIGNLVGACYICNQNKSSSFILPSFHDNFKVSYTCKTTTENIGNISRNYRSLHKQKCQKFESWCLDTTCLLPYYYKNKRMNKEIDWKPRLEYYIKCAPRAGYYIAYYPGHSKFDYNLQESINEPDEFWWSDTAGLTKHWDNFINPIMFAMNRGWFPLFAVSWKEPRQVIFTEITSDTDLNVINMQKLILTNGDNK